MKQGEILDNDLLIIKNEAEDYVPITGGDTIVMFDLMKAILRQNDVHFIVKNEMMLQTDPFLANTADNAKFMVRAEDLEHATQLLEDGGFRIRESGEMTDSISIFVDSITSKIPFLRDLRSELQMIIVFGTTAILFSFLAYLALNGLGFLETPGYY